VCLPRIGLRRRATLPGGRADARPRAARRAAGRRRVDESIAIQRETHDTLGLALSLIFRGALARAAGDLALARAAFEESTRLSRDRVARQDMVDGLDALASLAVAEGDARRAARRGLGEAAFRAAWEQGRATALEVAVEEALSGDRDR
jgi:hypothetical protein